MRADETALGYLQRLEPDASERDLRNFLGGFNFSGDDALNPIGPMSGGEKARSVLATIVRRKPNLLLLGEPLPTWRYWLAPLVGMALWPWVFLALDQARLARRQADRR